MSPTESPGFSLFEAVVAFAIASLALTALLQVYASSASTARRTATMADAVEIADNRLAALADPTMLVAGESSGTTALGYAWRMAITPEPPPHANAPMRLFRVTVTVAEPGGGAPLLAIETARHVPVDRRRESP